MSRLVEHAERELQLAGMFEADADYDGKLAPAIVAIVQKFSEQGFSGGAAAATLLLERLLAFKPLVPLTGNDDEWREVAGGVKQNLRYSAVFMEEGRAYDMSAPQPRAAITFPYIVR